MFQSSWWESLLHEEQLEVLHWLQLSRLAWPVKYETNSLEIETKSPLKASICEVGKATIEYEICKTSHPSKMIYLSPQPRPRNHITTVNISTQQLLLIIYDGMITFFSKDCIPSVQHFLQSWQGQSKDISSNMLCIQLMFINEEEKRVQCLIESSPMYFPSQARRWRCNFFCSHAKRSTTSLLSAVLVIYLLWRSCVITKKFNLWQYTHIFPSNFSQHPPFMLLFLPDRHRHQ